MPEQIATSSEVVVPKYQHCPICADGLGGVGQEISRDGRKVKFRCRPTNDERGCCGFSWFANLSADELAAYLKQKK